MKRILVFGFVLAFLASFMVQAVPFGVTPVQAATAHTYQVTVGYENVKQGALVQAFFPDTVTIHVGDTVHWVQGSHEIHTVTFLAGSPMPDLLIMAPPPHLNSAAAYPNLPTGSLYDGTSFANSGLMSLDPPFGTSYDLTFTVAGTYDYLCLVHGVTMAGKVVVLPADKHVPSPAQTIALGRRQLEKQVSKIEDLIKKASRMVMPPSRNSDGSHTYNIMIGYSQGQIDLMSFFPKKLNVRQGDTVVWSYGSSMSGMSMAPHTVSFLNGGADIPFVMPQTPPTPPQLNINPMVLGPLQPGLPLTRSGYFSSGLLAPGSPSTFYTLTIGHITGRIDYMCLLHDTSGMVGSLNVLPKH